MIVLNGGNLVALLTESVNFGPSTGRQMDLTVTPLRI